MVFNETAMRERLPKETFKALKKTMDEGTPLDQGVANIVANAMKDWAVEKGATHFTHWFQPMTGITAEKHDSFITTQGWRRSYYGVFRQGAGKGRVRRLQLSFRRHPRHL